MIPSLIVHCQNYRYSGVSWREYEWDDGKRDANLRKHGVDFRDAIPAIEDPNRLEEIDERGEYGEAGTAIIGVAHDRVLFVIVTLRGERYLPHHQCPEGGTT